MMTKMEWFALALCLMNFMGWIITLRNNRESRVLNAEHLKMARVRFEKEISAEQEYLTASDAYQKGFLDGKGSKI